MVPFNRFEGIIGHVGLQSMLAVIVLFFVSGFEPANRPSLNTIHKSHS